jgi:hypothetical protein
MHKGYKSLIILFIGVCVSILASTAQAADWGYDNEENEKRSSLSRPSLFARDSNIEPAKKPAIEPAKKTVLPNNKKPVITKTKIETYERKIDNFLQASSYWLELFDLISDNSLDVPNKQKIKQYLSNKAKQSPASMQAVLSINTYWPKVKDVITKNEEQKANYRDLFKSLLRMSNDANKSNTSSSDGEDIITDVIVQVLGPVRIAIAGNPALTEDSINSYADMACFLYEQKHPGKTIDADDNRLVFATVIREKFQNAPSIAAKQAMANFSLSWSKFKIAWVQANDETRHSMVDHLASDGVNTALILKNNPVLDSVLKQWQWP